MVAARQNPLPPSVQVQLGPFPRRRLQGYVRSASAPGADRPDHLRRLGRPLQNGGRQHKRQLGVRRRVACRTSSRSRGSYASAHPRISQWRVSWLPFGTYYKCSRTHVPRRNIHAVPTRSLCRAWAPKFTEAIGTKELQFTARFQSSANCMAEGSRRNAATVDMTGVPFPRMSFGYRSPRRFLCTP